MRILCLTPSYPPKIGGGERYAQALAEAAAVAGHDVTVVTTDIADNADFWRWHPERRNAPPTLALEHGVRVIRYPAIGLPCGWTALTLWRKAMVLLGSLGAWTAPLLERMSRRIPSIRGVESGLKSLPACDLVHVYNLSWEYPLILGWRLARQRGVPLIVTPFAHLGANVSARVTRNITMPHQLQVLRDAAAVLALPSAEAEGLIALGLDPNRIHAVGSGHDTTPRVSRASPSLLKEIEGSLVLFVGRISHDKGAICAADAIRELNRKRSDLVSLVMLGPIDRSFTRYYARLSAAERAYVRLVGPVSEEDKHAFLDRSEMLVLPSRVDSFGIVFLEAWSHGKPVIGARAGGIPGVIDDGVDGLLVPWGDVRSLAGAIRALLDDPEQARAMGAAGRLKTQTRYTWPAVYGLVEGIYEKALAEKDHSTVGPAELPCA